MYGMATEKFDRSEKETKSDLDKERSHTVCDDKWFPMHSVCKGENKGKQP